jgi:hypothetical protein
LSAGPVATGEFSAAICCDFFATGEFSAAICCEFCCHRRIFLPQFAATFLPRLLRLFYCDLLRLFLPPATFLQLFAATFLPRLLRLFCRDFFAAICCDFSVAAVLIAATFRRIVFLFY